MTNKEKQLLLKDLCARLPYGVKIQHREQVHQIKCISSTGEFQNYDYDAWFDISNCKPYLRPMSSMTEEEISDFDIHSYVIMNEALSLIGHEARIKECEAKGIDIDWLNAHHFDYRGLIEKGLALPAPEGIY